MQKTLQQLQSQLDALAKDNKFLNAELVRQRQKQSHDSQELKKYKLALSRVKQQVRTLQSRLESFGRRL